MKQKVCLILLVGIFFTTNILAKDNEVINSAEIEQWVHGSLLGDNSLFVFLDSVTQTELLEYANLNSISSFAVSVFWKNDATSEITQIGSNIVNDVTSGFEVDSWSFTVTGDYNIDPNSTPQPGSIGNVLPGSYQFQIIYNNELCGPLVDLPLIIDTIEEEEEDLPIELPNYNCGDQFTLQPVSNTNSVAFAPGDILQIAGFPILVQAGGPNGSGIIPIPFGKKAVSVTFNGIQANDEGHVFSGTISSNSDSPLNYPDFNLISTPLNIGGDICQPPPPAPGYNSEGVDPVTGLDPRMFDPNTGLHSNGTPYDGNGFDIDGNYLDTGQPYNDQGCNYQGFDENGNRCNVEGPAYAPSGEYANSISDSLENVVPGLLTGLVGEVESELQNLNCTEIRNTMENLINTLQFTRDFVFGENDVYFKKDMHLNFKQRPQKLVLNIERNADAKLLEEKHIELYDCDKKEYGLETVIEALNEIITNIGYHDIFNEVLEAISNWNEYQYNIYTNDPAAFNDWLLRELGTLIKDMSGLDDTYNLLGSVSQDDGLLKRQQKNYIQSIFDFNRSENLMTSAIASLEKNYLVEDKFTLEDASFLYLQGEKEINGFDRALFMEEIYLKRKMIATETNENLTPIVVSKTVGNKTYNIYLDNIGFSVNGATLDAHAVIEDPESGKKLIFSATGLSFNPTGLSSEAKLSLGTDIEVRLNNAAMFILKGTDDTFVEFDCDGFKTMSIDAQIEFCRDFITPLDPVTLDPKPGDERYRLEFKIEEISSWLEFSLEVNAEPFAVTQFTDVKWELTQMIIDMSSTYTPDFLPLPGYTSPHWDESGQIMSPAWKGFYVNTLSATFPNSFSNNNDKLTASANDILIDGCGFSGNVAVETELISIDDGNAGGWPFSIDELEITILKNQFAGAGFGGEIKVPIFEEAMDYSAVMYPENNYKFAVTPNESVTVDMFLATGEIYEDSKIEIGYDSEGFHSVATLHGKITPSTGSQENSFSVELPSLCFQEFRVSNRAPYFDAGTWGLVDSEGNAGAIGASFNGFEIKVSGLQPYSDGDSAAGLNLDVDVVLSNKIDVAAGGGFGIEGELVHDSNGQQKWQYKRIDVQSFYVDASFPSGYVKGQLEWFGEENNPDPVWGKGFRGAVSAGFEGFDGLNLSAAAQFGKKSDFKYFYIDAILDLGEAAIPLGPLNLQGFGGGLSYHMNTEQVGGISTSGSGFALPPIGGSFSNTVYTVDESKGLGLKATALISTSGVQSVFNGSVSLSFLFNDSGGGLNKIELTGSGQFLADPTESIAPNYTDNATTAPAGAGSLSCFINLTYNFDQPSFEGTLQAFLNSAFANGSLPGGKMVDATMHFDPEKWYIYVGKPGEGERCGIIVDLGVGGTGIESSAYLNVGTDVPPMAALPNEVKEIAYLVNTNESLRNSGQGFVFGASMKITMGASIAGIINTNITALAGFDMMLRKYEGYSCAGSTGEVGFNGWYASGQMYAYISGALEVGGATVAELALAAVLQARLPNPFWAQATVGVRVRIAGINFNKSLKLELGEDCTLVGSNPNPQLGIDVISWLDPLDASVDVPTSTIPTANFAIPLSEDVSINDINGNLVVYKAELISAELVSEEGFILSGNVVFNEDKTKLSYVLLDMLPSNNEITFTVKVEIFKDGVYLDEESKSVIFNTGQSLDYIPLNNIVSSYPIPGMANFHKEEYNAQKGFIYLESGQPELLVYHPEGYTNAIRLIASTGETEYLEMEYDIISRKIEFDLPANLLFDEKAYRLDILLVSESFLSSLQGSTTNSNSTSGSTGPSGPVNAPTPLLTSAFASEEPPSPPPANYNSAETNASLPLMNVVYSMYFRTSKYPTFKSKMQAIESSDPGLNKDLSNLEYFGDLEINGSINTDKLISYKPNFSDPYIQNEIKPVLESFEVYDCSGNEVMNLEDSENYDLIYIPTAGSISKNEFDDGITVLTSPKFIKELKLFYNFGFRKFIGDNLAIVNECGQLAAVFETFSFECDGGGGTPANVQMLACEKVEEILEIQNAIANLPPLYPGTYEVDFIYAIPTRNGKITTTVESLTFNN